MSVDLPVLYPGLPGYSHLPEESEIPTNREELMRMCSSAGSLFINGEGKVLLGAHEQTLYIDEDDREGVLFESWGPFAGGRHEGESVRATIDRETIEESGLNTYGRRPLAEKIILVPEGSGWKVGVINIFLWMEEDQESLTIPNNEITRCHWFNAGQLLGLREFAQHLLWGDVYTYMLLCSLQSKHLTENQILVCTKDIKHWITGYDGDERDLPTTSFTAARKGLTNLDV